VQSVLILIALAAPAVAQDEQLRFAVIGHIRGDPVGDTTRNPMLDEIVDECRRIDPDLLFLTGDNIWGDYWNIPAHPDVVEHEWDVLDSALQPLGIPVHRVPGNHDISDLTTRDIYFRRYGRIPKAFTVGGSLFLLLSTAWIPADGDTTQAHHIHGVPLDQEQLDFVTDQLANTPHEHAFIFVHHLHWWRENAFWWSTVHPLLVGKKVRAVIGGDYGPTKYSYERVDGIDYVHAAVAVEPDTEMLMVNEEARMLNQQLDGILVFDIDGPEVHFGLRAVGLEDRKHSPNRWTEINKPPPLDYIYYSTLKTTRRRELLALILTGAGFAAGAVTTLLLVWIARRWRRRRTM